MDAAAEQGRDHANPPESGLAWRAQPVSFARRGGRLTERQQKAWDEMHATHVVDVPRHGLSTSVDPDYRFDPEAVFGRDAPLVVEIGPGRGEALVAAAADQPDHDFLGLEVYVPGVAQTLVTMRHRDVTNVRLAVVNAVEALATMLDPVSVRELWTWFPDPWHKLRHHKRRLVSVPFTALVARVLEPGGTWRFATDWDEYAFVVADVIATSPHVVGGPAERYDGRVLTRFEGKGIAAGRTIHDLSARPTLTE